MSDNPIDVLADFLLRQGPMNIEPLAVRQRLAKALLDVVDAQRGAGVHQALRDALEPFAHTADVYEASIEGANRAILDEVRCAGTEYVLKEPLPDTHRVSVTMGDCRRARAALTSTDGSAPAITMEQVVDWLNANTSSYTMQPRDRPHAQND